MDDFSFMDARESPAPAVAYDPAKCLERLGKLTASKAAIIMGKLDTSGLDGYVKDLAWERVNGARDEEYRNAAMDRGNELEPLALDWYEGISTGYQLIRTPGFMLHPTIAYVGASPDAIALDAGERKLTVQTKCPLHRAWMETRRQWLVPSEYRWQCKWEMWVVGVQSCDFVTWHPVAGGLICIERVTPDECAAMAERAALVNERVIKWVEILEDKRRAA